MPFDGLPMLAAALHPGGHLPIHGVDLHHTSVHTQAGRHTETALGHVQSTAMPEGTRIPASPAAVVHLLQRKDLVQ